jgi:hypothetical protein
MGYKMEHGSSYSQGCTEYSRTTRSLQMHSCKCLEVLPIRVAIVHIAEEAVELFEVKNFDELKDEASDVMWGIGRLLGAMAGKPYISVWGDALHRRKVEARMAEYGCVRSKRHLKDGECPSL